MKPRSRASSAARFAIILSALLLPSLSLTVFGGLYLWEQGWLLPWAIASAVVVSLVYGFQKWLFGQADPRPNSAAASPDTITDAHATSHPAWTPGEQLAWRDVRKIAAAVDPNSLTDIEALSDLAHRTINAVANRIHPGKEDAVWRFTMPEALTISERVSARLNDFIVENIPFGDKLTVSQVLQVYSWRSVANVAERAYDIWRVIRLANPATAVTNEARERLSRAMMQWGRDHVAKRLAETFVEEVGRAAIDLYGGRLKISHQHVSGASAVPVPANEDGFEGETRALEIVVAADTVEDRRAVAELLRTMERKRADAIASFLRGETMDDSSLRYRALMVREFALPTEAAAARKVAAAKAALFANADVLVIATRNIHAMSESAHDALLAATSKARVVAPVLIPIVLDTQTRPSIDAAGATIPPLAGEMPRLNTAYAGASAKAVRTSLSPTTDSAERAIWQTLAAVATELRRITLLRRIDEMKGSGSWLQSGAQAAKAFGRLSRALLHRRTEPDTRE